LFERTVIPHLIEGVCELRGVGDGFFGTGVMVNVSNWGGREAEAIIRGNSSRPSRLSRSVNSKERLSLLVMPLAMCFTRVVGHTEYQPIKIVVSYSTRDCVPEPSAGTTNVYGINGTKLEPRNGLFRKINGRGQN